MVDSQTLNPLQTSDDDDEPEPRKPSIALEIARAAAKATQDAAGVLRENEDALEIDDELIDACKAVSTAWDKLATRLIKKRASTLPKDGQSGDAAGDPTQVTKRRGRPPGSKNKPKEGGANE